MKCIKPSCSNKAYATKNLCHKHYWHDVFMVRKPLYGTWRSMKARCYSPNATNYADYGGRGIKVCDRWLVYENFAKDMGEKPSSQHTLDRIDNDGDYTPENCRWATKKEQIDNRRVEAKARSNNQSGEIGIRFKNGRWNARGRYGKHIGNFDTKEEAVEARLRETIKSIDKVYII